MMRPDARDVRRFIRVCAAAPLVALVALTSCDQGNTPPPSIPAAAAVTPSARVPTLPTPSFEKDEQFAAYLHSIDSKVFQGPRYCENPRLTPDGRTALADFRTWQLPIVWELSDTAAPPRMTAVTAGVPFVPHKLTAVDKDCLWVAATLSPDGNWLFALRIEGDNYDAFSTLLRIDLAAGKETHRWKRAEEDGFDVMRPTFSPDSRSLLSGCGYKAQLALLDPVKNEFKLIPVDGGDTWPGAAPDGRVVSAELALISDDRRVLVSRRRSLKEGDKGYTLDELGVARLRIADNGAKATLEDLHWIYSDRVGSARLLAASRDGRQLLLLTQGDTLALPLWHWTEAVAPPKQVATLDVKLSGGEMHARFTADGRRLALSDRGSLHTFDIASLQLPADIIAPKSTLAAPFTPSDVAWTADGKRIICVGKTEDPAPRAMSFDPDAPLRFQAHIGESQITWDRSASRPKPHEWPALKPTAKLWLREDESPATLIVEVEYTGAGPATGVTATLTAIPPLPSSPSSPDAHGANAKPAVEGPDKDATPTETARVLMHLGAIERYQTVKRFVDLPGAAAGKAALSRHARRFSVHIHEQSGATPAPIHWLYLPRTITTEEQYHATARKVYETGIAVLAEARGKPMPPTKLVAMTPERFGFMVSFGSNVLYQNPFTMNDAAMNVNRAVMQVDSLDDLMRHGQMMLYWYLPHELVHCIDNQSGWQTEYAANMVQPYLTAEILKRLPDAPYTAETMAFVYDRYVQELRPHLSDEDLAAIERFIITEGKGQPFPMSSYEVFEKKTPAYVYFGARINQHAWAMKMDLKKMIALCTVPHEAPAEPSK